MTFTSKCCRSIIVVFLTLFTLIGIGSAQEPYSENGVIVIDTRQISPDKAQEILPGIDSEAGTKAVEALKSATEKAQGEIEAKRPKIEQAIRTISGDVKKVLDEVKDALAKTSGELERNTTSGTSAAATDNSSGLLAGSPSGTSGSALNPVIEGFSGILSNLGNLFRALGGWIKALWTEITADTGSIEKTISKIKREIKTREMAASLKDLGKKFKEIWKEMKAVFKGKKETTTKTDDSPKIPSDGGLLKGAKWVGPSGTNAQPTKKLTQAKIAKGLVHMDYDELAGWPKSKDGGLNAYTCVFVERDGKLVGGKFDWLRVGQKMKVLKNIPEGYIKGVQPKKGEKVWFCLLSLDGKNRTNLVESRWP
jgi:hypothetical protein